MSIEFRCTHCGKLLQTPPGSEGRQAKCPQCGSLQDIPSHGPGAPPHEPQFDAPPLAPPPETSNPYRAPSEAALEPDFGSATRGFRPTKISSRATFDRAWWLYKSNFWLVAGGGAISILLMTIVDQVVQRIFGTQSRQFAVGFELHIGDPETSLRQIAAVLVAQAIHAFFWLGLVNLSLKVARGEPAGLGDLFAGGNWYLRGVAVHLITTVLVGVGMMFCFIPGVWVALTLCLALYMVVDQQTGVLESLQLSARAMKGNRLTVLGLWLVLFGLLVLVAVFSCGLGLFPFLPLVVMVMAVTYQGATGQLTPPADSGMVAAVPAE